MYIQTDRAINTIFSEPDVRFSAGVKSKDLEQFPATLCLHSTNNTSASGDWSLEVKFKLRGFS